MTERGVTRSLGPSPREPGARLPVATSLFAETGLAEWLETAFDLNESPRCRLVSRSMNDTFRVTASRDVWYPRVSPHGWRSRPEVESELAFIQLLREHGLRVGIPIPRRDGATISSLAAPEGERLAVLFAAVAGSEVPNIGISQSRAYGRLAARLHRAADAWGNSPTRPEIGIELLLDHSLAAVGERFSGETAEVGYLESIAARVRAELDRLPREAPGFGLCHGDLHPGNIRFDEAGVPALFDFDLAGNGWRIYDLTVFLWNAFGERRPRRWRDSRWRAFIAGYREVRDLDDVALVTVPLFLVARQLWLLGADCRGEIGWPVQFLTPQYLKEASAAIRGWEAEYPILRAS